MTDHFKCSKCGARGHLVTDREDCPNCGGPIYPVVITRPAPHGPCSYCDAYDALAEACAMPSQYACPLEARQEEPGND